MPRKRNPPDVLTKGVDKTTLERHPKVMSLDIRTTRAPEIPSAVAVERS